MAVVRTSYQWYDKESEMYFPGFVTKQRLGTLKDFEVRSDDVFITTLFRSGSHWAAHILKLLSNNGEPYAGAVYQAVPLWEGGKASATEVDLDFNGMPSPRFFRSHFPYEMMPGGLPHTTQAKYIYIVRNPKDVIVSSFHYLRSMKEYRYQGSLSEYIDYFLCDEYPFRGWFGNALSWWEHRDKPNVLFLKFEDMKKDLSTSVGIIASFLGYHVNPSVLAKVAQMSVFETMKKEPSCKFSETFTWPAMNPNGAPLLRKGQVGDWKTHFTTEQSEYFDAEYDKRMKNTGLELEFEL